MKTQNVLLCLLLTLSINAFSQDNNNLKGSWKGDDGVYTFTDGFYSYASFNNKEFLGTHGGHFQASEGKLKRTLEYNTFDSATVGTSKEDNISLKGDALFVNGKRYSRFDDGTPGELQGAWLISGRMQDDGQIGEIRPGPRKTMKILSGKRFQWIAYNTETKKFMGTGGGTYTTENGTYTEKIDFFSRDPSRVGASLPFEYEIKDGKWHHFGNSSKGDPIAEVWSRRPADNP